MKYILLLLFFYFFFIFFFLGGDRIRGYRDICGDLMVIKPVATTLMHPACEKATQSLHYRY